MHCKIFMQQDCSPSSSSHWLGCIAKPFRIAGRRNTVWGSWGPSLPQSAFSGAGFACTLQWYNQVICTPKSQGQSSCPHFLVGNEIRMFEFQIPWFQPISHFSCIDGCLHFLLLWFRFQFLWPPWTSQALHEVESDFENLCRQHSKMLERSDARKQVFGGEIPSGGIINGKNTWTY